MNKIYFITFLFLFSCCAIGCALDFKLEKKDGSVEDVEVADGEDLDVFEEVNDAPGCGNGTVDGDEECDDGANGNDADGCTDACEFSCHGDLDCRDVDMCNGEETCNTETHMCEAGSQAADGTVCGEDPRSICLDGACQISTCGDGFVDTGAGESCEPPNEGSCNENCRLTCESDLDCPDDGNICNGEEYCDTTVPECSHRDPPPDGTVCQTTPRMICIAQTCQESVCGDGFIDGAEGEECDDGNTDSTDACTNACLNAECGDGFVWAGVEECDSTDPVSCVTECGITGEGMCSEDCTLPLPSDCQPLPGECCTPTDCDDSNVCTVDDCVSNNCQYTPVSDGQACPTGFCCSGVCQECCDDTYCDDFDPCTDDSCSSGSCVNNPLADLTPCPGGACCSGVCTAGAECCTDADCTDGCKGTAAACSDFDMTTCETQTGCTLTAATPRCLGRAHGCWNYSIQSECEACSCSWVMSDCEGGRPSCGTFTDESSCTACGCTWGYPPCSGTGDPCSDHDYDPPECHDCGCDFDYGSGYCTGFNRCGQVGDVSDCSFCGCSISPPPCSGTHPPCNTYSSDSACNTELDCYWSVCTGNVCT